MTHQFSTANYPHPPPLVHLSNLPLPFVLHQPKLSLLCGLTWTKWQAACASFSDSFHIQPRKLNWDFFFFFFFFWHHCVLLMKAAIRWWKWTQEKKGAQISQQIMMASVWMLQECVTTGGHSLPPLSRHSGRWSKCWLMCRGLALSQLLALVIASILLRIWSATAREGEHDSGRSAQWTPPKASAETFCIYPGRSLTFTPERTRQWEVMS